MIADPTMFAKPLPRRCFLAGRLQPANRHTLAERAATLRNESTIALLAGDRDKAQVKLSDAEWIEWRLRQMDARPPFEPLLFMLGGEG